MSDTKTVELEIVTDDKLVVYAKQTGLEPTTTTSLVEAFRPIFVEARQAITAAAGVAESVKDATCVKEIKRSRACRLAIRAVRLKSEATRKAQKEQALRFGKAVDGFHNILLADLSPVEIALQEAEDVAERAEAARLAQLKADREKELGPLLDTPILGDLSELTEAQYAKALSDAKLLLQAKLDAIAKAEAEAKAKAEADRQERERIAAENARLKAEADAREAAARAEREEAAQVLAAERAAAEAAAKAAAEQARKDREAAEAKIKAEREAAAKAARLAAEQAQRDREAVEAKARSELAAAEAEAKKERERLEAVAAEERRKLAAAKAREKAQRDAEAKKGAEAAAAARKAAAAPDNAKAQAFAAALRALPLPKFTTTKVFDSLPAKVEALAKWIEAQIGEGGL